MQINIETLKAMRKSGLLLILVQIAAGVALIVLPNILPNGFIKFIGIVCVILGGVLVYINMKRPKEYSTWQSYLFPVILIGLGIFVFFYTNATFKIIAIAMGIAIILKGIGTIFLKDSPVTTTKRYKIFGVISICIGVSVIILSNYVQEFLSYYLAAILFYHAVVDVLIYLDLLKIIDSAEDSNTIDIQ